MKFATPEENCVGKVCDPSGHFDCIYGDHKEGNWFSRMRVDKMDLWAYYQFIRTD